MHVMKHLRHWILFILLAAVPGYAAAASASDFVVEGGKPFRLSSSNSNSSIGPFEWTSDWSQINGIKIIVIIIIILLCLGFLGVVLCAIRWYNGRKDAQYQTEMTSSTPIPAQSDFEVNVASSSKKISRKKSKGGGEHVKSKEVIKTPGKAYTDTIVETTVTREGPARGLDEVPQAKAWTRRYDDKSGRYYYFNRDSQEKSWERPAEMDDS